MERLAALAHDIWAYWMRYMFSCCILNRDGTMTIPKDKVERWTRQTNTPYKNLPEREKVSDRDIVRQFILPVILSAYE